MTSLSQFVPRVTHQARFELLVAGRNPRARFFTFFFPLVMLVIFAGVFHGHTTVAGVHVKLSRYFTAGILAMSIVFASYANLVTVICSLRSSGVLKRRRATPVSPAVLVGGQAIAAVFNALVTTVVLLVVSSLLYGVGFSVAAIAAVAIDVVVGALVFASIGYAVSGLVGSPDAAQPIVQATTMPLWFLSGVLIPTQSISGGLRLIGEIFPVEHLAAALHLASIHSGFADAVSLKDLGILAAWGVAAVLVASWRFSWLPSGAGA